MRSVAIASCQDRGVGLVWSIARVFTVSAHLISERGPGRMATAEVSSSAKSITIDRAKHLNEEPHTGHNRWHPDVTPVIEVEPGEQVVLETRDALDGYLNAEATVADLAGLPIGAVHPLTGPVSVKGAKPGDLLEIA